MLRDLSRKSFEEIIEVARNNQKGDFVIKNARVINVFNESIEKSDVIVKNGVIAGVGNYNNADKIFDIKGAYVAPSFIDSHVHIESSMLLPQEFAKIVVPCGTTTIVTDPHEIANVSGMEGIKFMIEASKGLPFDTYFMLSSCVPATMFCSSGASLSAVDLSELISYPQVLGLAEMMNVAGVLSRDNDILDKLFLFREKIIDGHAPQLTGKDLNAYIAANIMADHECTSSEEALEKISRGMYIMLREGSVTRDVVNLLPAINDKTKHRFLFCTDDRHPEDIMKSGHINYAVNLAVEGGLSLPIAVRIATLNPAQFFGFKFKGAIAPGYIADLVVFKNLSSIDMVFKNGKLVAKDNKPLFNTSKIMDSYDVKDTVKLDAVTYKDFEISAKDKKIRVIKTRKNSIITDEVIVCPKVIDNKVVSDVRRDIIKIAVVERHKKTGNIGIGFIKGLGIKKGAIATSVSHDSHNIIVVGENDADMALAVNQIRKIGGGHVITKDGKVLGSLALPYAGLMSDQDAYSVYQKLLELHRIIKDQEVANTTNPFMTLAFMSLDVVPSIKITDKGIVDVKEVKLVDIFEI